MKPPKLGRKLLVFLLIGVIGCAHPQRPNSGHHDLWDLTFRRRHAEPIVTAHDDMLTLARELTVIEDDLRRDGTITVKSPDVWGDGNLVQAIGENDKQLAEKLGSFTDNLQAYIARSDQAEAHLTSATAAGLNGTAAPDVSATVNTIGSGSTLTASPELFAQLKDLPDLAKPKASGLGIEPTESVRQLDTYLQVIQSLRRRNMGDDNSRAAGYGLYLFRVPVSVLPGRETAQGFAAVATLRAQVQVDEAHLKYMLPKLAIADLVDALAPYLIDNWNTATESDQVEKINKLFGIVRGKVQARFSTDESVASKLVDAAKVCEDSLKMSELEWSKASYSKYLNDIKKIIKENNKSTSDSRGAEEDEESAEETGPAQEDLKKQPIDSMNNIIDMADSDFAQSQNWGLGSTPLSSLPNLISNIPTAIVSSPPSYSQKSVNTPVRGAVASVESVYGKKELSELRRQLRDYLRSSDSGQSFPPKLEDLRTFLFKYFAQVHVVLEAQKAYSISNDQAVVDPTLVPVIAQAAHQTEMGADDTSLRNLWEKAVYSLGTDPKLNIPKVGWPLAKQIGVVDLNLKRILAELRLKGKITHEEEDQAKQLYFFQPEHQQLMLTPWKSIIREEFPIQVFSLDPQVEEQNVYDAFARRREMQLALAYGVAKGTFNNQQKVNLSRRLGLDTADIGLNRTAVAFSHGNDTFGWYFYPRVQAPPPERSNIAALARTIWSTGPTDRYDMRHRKLEPGIRECEVLVAMPSFINEVSFDVTTNWERVAKPGMTKRSYEEMIAQGGRLHRLRACLQTPQNQNCYRPGDLDRMLSRIDQMEHMLGMQTYRTNIPYAYEQSASDLFDSGKEHLKPLIRGYYGLEHIKAGSTNTASFFVTGKNFHPTNTHVIVGGFESHSPGQNAKVEVLSRELIKVEVGTLIQDLSPEAGFEIRVGTPAGMSNTFAIRATPVAKAPPEKKSDFDWKTDYTVDASVTYKTNTKKPPSMVTEVVYQDHLPSIEILDRNEDIFPIGTKKATLAISLEIVFKDGTKRKLGSTPPFVFESKKTFDVIQTVLDKNLKPSDGNEFTVVGTTYLKYDAWPFVKFDTPITIQFVKAPGK